MVTPAQVSLFSPGSGGIETSSIEQRLHSHRADASTSRCAVPTKAKRESQESRVLSLQRKYGPGTSWELAEAAWDGTDRLGARNVDQLYHTIQRRMSGLERAGLVTCDRVRDSEGKTVSARTKVCGVTGEIEIEWRVA